MKKPVISVIVPIYNTDQYLRQCVDSILGQSYRELEVILVDDGSTDNCPEICEEYKRKDNRVHVIHKANGGQAGARNSGLDAANGDFISFVDSDDWIALNLYDTLVGALETFDTDIACCGTTLVYMNGDSFTPPTERRMYNPQEALKDLLTTDMLRCEVTNKIFHRILFDKIRFPEGRIYEDQAVVFQLLGTGKITIHTGQPGYFYRRRPESSMAKCRPVDGLRLFHRNLKKINRYLKADYPSLLTELKEYRAKNHLWYMTMTIQGGIHIKSEEYRTIKRYFMRDFRILFSRSNAKQRVKLLTLASDLYGVYWKLSGKKIQVSGLQELNV